MGSVCKLEDFATSFAPYIEELHEFFKSRDVPFGAPENVAPAVERLAKDADFRAEMASMVRATIYRVRDGLSRFELLELMLVALGGNGVGEASDEIQEPARQLFAFINDVFRSRWNPGAASHSASHTEDVTEATPPEDRANPEQAPAAEVLEPVAISEPELEMESIEPPAPAEPIEPSREVRPSSAIFYRALVVAGSEPEQAFSERAEATEAEAPAPEPAHVLPPIGEFHGAVVDRPSDGKRQSWHWFWIATAGALLLAVSPLVFLRSGGVKPFAARDQNPIAASPAAAPQKPSPMTVRDARSRNQSAPVQMGASPPALAANRPAPVVRVQGNQANSAAIVETAKAASSEHTAAHGGEHTYYIPRATFGVSAGVMAARLVSAPEPEYPVLAKITHVQGKVVVEAVIARDGSVVQAHVVSGHRVLRAAALQEVYQRQYRPYILDDRARDVATLVTVDFTLHP
jgi:outer membrane biosynthesis protein TonB